MPDPVAKAPHFVAHRPKEVVVNARAPYRISTGAQDLEGTLKSIEGGWGVATTATIDEFHRVQVKVRYPSKGGFIAKYHNAEENWPKAEKIRHDLFREALKRVLTPRKDRGGKIVDSDAVLGNIESLKKCDIEISSTGSMSSEEGTGLSSSSALTVAVLDALYMARDGKRAPAEQLAQDAIAIDRRAALMEAYRKLPPDEDKVPPGTSDGVGRQDPYAIAYGGWNSFTFHADGRTDVMHIGFTAEEGKRLDSMFVLIPTNVRGRTGTDLITKQANSAKEKADLAAKQREISVRFRDALLEKNLDPELIGTLFDQGWQIKRQLGDGITNPAIDKLYSLCKSAGMIGGRLVGAGGGGYLLAVVHSEKRDEFIQNMAERGHQALNIHITLEGSTSWIEPSAQTYAESAL